VLHLTRCLPNRVQAMRGFAQTAGRKDSLWQREVRTYCRSPRHCGWRAIFTWR
jgi:hypothetical protein